MSKTVKRIYIITTILIMALLAVETIPPLMAWWNRPLLLGSGWPISEIAIIVISLLMCIVMCVANVIENKITAKEKEMRKRGEKIDY